MRGCGFKIDFSQYLVLQEICAYFWLRFEFQSHDPWQAHNCRGTKDISNVMAPLFQSAASEVLLPSNVWLIVFMCRNLQQIYFSRTFPPQLDSNSTLLPLLKTNYQLYLLVEVVAVLLLPQVVQAIMWFFLSFYRYSFLRYLKSLVLYGSCKITTLYSVNVVAVEDVDLLDRDDYKSLSLNIVMLCLCCLSGVTILKYAELEGKLKIHTAGGQRFVS